jgi:hypothetical protein
MLKLWEHILSTEAYGKVIALRQRLREVERVEEKKQKNKNQKRKS